MAKADNGRDRRAVLEELRKQQKAKDRRRSLLVLGACVVVGAVIIGIAVFAVLREREESSRALEELGAAQSAAGCQETVTESAEGTGDHVAPGTPIPYPDAPPAFGAHYDSAQPMTRKFYTSDDRPEVGTLVHNLEHGFTILWYDEAIADDDEQLAAVRDITQKYPATGGLDDKFLAVPWTSEDGEEFPDGAHIALTHWSSGGTNGNPEEPTGVWQYCESVSGEVVDQFVTDYPFLDAPEGNVPG